MSAGPVKVTSRAWMVMQVVISRAEPSLLDMMFGPGWAFLTGVQVVVDDGPEAFDCCTPEEALAFAASVARPATGRAIEEPEGMGGP